MSVVVSDLSAHWMHKRRIIKVSSLLAQGQQPSKLFGDVVADMSKICIAESQVADMLKRRVRMW